MIIKDLFRPDCQRSTEIGLDYGQNLYDHHPRKHLSPERHPYGGGEKSIQSRLPRGHSRQRGAKARARLGLSRKAKPQHKSQSGLFRVPFCPGRRGHDLRAGPPSETLNTELLKTDRPTDGQGVCFFRMSRSPGGGLSSSSLPPSDQGLKTTS